MRRVERVLVVGEALVDIVHRPGGQIDEHPGGSPLNVAIGLARLGHEVDYAARFARDHHGRLIADHLAREGSLRVVPGADDAARTSTARAFLDDAGVATYEFDLHWDVGEVLDDAPVGHLHTGSIAATLLPGAQDVLAAARRTRLTGTVSYDPNARPSIMGSPDGVRGSIEELIGLSDVVKASEEDVAWLYPGRRLEAVLDEWAQAGPRLCVVTRGGQGCVALLAATGETAVMPAAEADVVDTVGAGDSFMSGLLSGLLDAGLLGGLEARDRLASARLADIRPALDRADACAAITVSRAGANPPTRAELGGRGATTGPK